MHPIIKMVAVLAILAPSFALAIPPLQPCFRDSECPGKEVCLYKQCQEGDQELVACGTDIGGTDGGDTGGGSDGADSGFGQNEDGCYGTDKCVDDYCKSTDVHCHNDHVCAKWRH